MEQFGKYEIIRELGRGGMGVVFHARDTDLGREVALKVMKPDSSWTEAEATEFRRRFEIEAQATAALHHPNIVTLFDRGEFNGIPFMAIAFVEGETLDALLQRRGKLPLDEALQILRPVAAALDYAHTKNVIHRDIKPPNIMIQKDGHVFVMDFGIAKAAHVDGKNSSKLFGSPKYMAPEQLRFEKPTKGIDQWSLGVVAYEMLAGRAPFAETEEGPYYAILNEEPEPLDGSELGRAVAKALSKQADSRYPTCGAFVEALATAMGPVREKTVLISKAVTQTPTEVVSRLEPPPPSRVLRDVTLCIGSLAVVAIGVAFVRGALSNRQTPDPIPTVNENHDPYVNPKDGLTYVWIPPGIFLMGCSDGDLECESDEKPPRRKAVERGFWIGKTEVTQRAWKRVMDSDASHFKGDDLPVEEADWSQATSYCQVVGGRLPTEIEWEYAARGGSTAARYGAVDSIAWSTGNSGGNTHPVGEKADNGYGLYDMLGNVWEWTSTAENEFQVLRGGSWYNVSANSRASVRLRLLPSVRYSNIGLRCIVNPR